MSAVQRFCNRAMIIENGLIKKIGKPSDIADIYTEDNIESAESAESKNEVDKEKSKYRLSLQTTVDNSFVKLDFQFTGVLDITTTYIGFTLFKDGMNIGEINSMDKTAKNNQISYNLDTKQLNPGIYEISGAMFEKETRAPLAILHKRKKITIKGYDPVRGSGLKMQDNWQV
jgi:ABC-type methionine transport system ATPase subunit